jgi:alpha-1,2-mannosyltransferase
MLAAAVIVGVAAAAWFTWVDVVPRSDLKVFLKAGADVLHGRNPYPALDDPFLYSGRAFVYPIAAALPFVPLSALPLGVADVLFYLISVGAILLAARLAGVTDVRTIVFALLAATTLRSFQVGSLNALLMLGCVAGWRYRDQAVKSAAALAAVVVAKLFVVPIGGWLLITRRWRAAAYMAGMIAAVLGLGWLLGPMGLGDYRTLLEILSHHENGAGWSFQRVLVEYGAAKTSARLVSVVAALALVGAAWAWYRRSSQEVAVFASCIAAALLVSPIVWSHYFVLLLAPLLVARVRWYVTALFAVTSWLIAPPAAHEQVSSFINDLTTWEQRGITAQLLVVGTVLAAALSVRWNARAAEPAHVT